MYPRYIIVPVDNIPYTYQQQYKLIQEELFIYHNKLSNIQNKYDDLLIINNKLKNNYDLLYNTVDNIQNDISNLNNLIFKFTNIDKIFNEKINYMLLINNNLKKELQNIYKKNNILKEKNELNINKINFLEKIINPLQKKETDYKNKIKSLYDEIEKYKYIISDKDDKILNLTSKFVKKQLSDVYLKYSNDEAQLIHDLEEEKEKNNLISMELIKKEKKIEIQSKIIESLKIKNNLHDYI